MKIKFKDASELAKPLKDNNIKHTPFIKSNGRYSCELLSYPPSKYVTFLALTSDVEVV